ncbi:MAG: molybdopterin-dependent oxidoreductase [Eggerthellaceae bacterium]|nr:molybdopterin-dependent oxidoreductase [Eggerthellaceae bacterium]
MSNEKTTPAGLTRRGFLKTTVAAMGIAATGSMLAGCSAEPELAVGEGATYVPGQVLSEGEQIFRGTCRPNCFGFCHLNVHVKDGRIIKTSRGDYDDPRYSRICHRGLSHPQRVYNEERVKYPMRRVEGTERGAGQWERITWDEAIAEIVSKIQEYREAYGPGSVAVALGSSLSSSVTSSYTRLLQALSMTMVLPSYDQASSWAMTRVAGTVNDWRANERTDLVNAKTIVAWGANITDAQVQQWHFVKEAMQGGTKLVVIDPTFTFLAAKADKWVPIRPGADTALLLGTINEIFARDALNVPYVQQHTVAPFLVRSDTGRFLRYSEVSPEAAVAKAAQEAAAQEAALAAMQSMMSQGQLVAGMAYQAVLESMAYDDQPVVMQGGVPVEASKATDPDLLATFDVQGVACETALSLLKDSVALFTPEKVAELTEIPENVFAELVDIFLDQPVTHYVGYGSQAYANGLQTTHAGMTMCGLIGNLGYPGASYGAYWVSSTATNMMYNVGAGIGTSPMIVDLDLAEVMTTGKFQGEDYPIKMLYVFSGNPINCSPDTNRWLTEVLPRLDFIVTADPMMTDTAHVSDLVLPVCQWFELEDITNMGETGCFNYSEKAIDPLYESKSDVEICHLIATGFGLGDYFPKTSGEALAQIHAGEEAEAIGATYENIKQKKEVRFLDGSPYIPFKDGVFATPSGRLEFYAEDPQPRNASNHPPTAEDMALEHLPHWFAPFHAWPESEDYQKYPLVCMSERPRFRVHSQWHSVPALRELDPEPTVKVNPIDAEVRGIEGGMYVECYNDLGRAVARVVLSEAVRPGTLVYPKGWHRSQFKAGSWSELIPADFDKYAMNSSFMDTVCEIRPWEEGSDR